MVYKHRLVNLGLALALGFMLAQSCNFTVPLSIDNSKEIRIYTPDPQEYCGFGQLRADK